MKTIDEFCERLAETTAVRRLRWRVQDGHWIRTRRCYCPLEEVDSVTPPILWQRIPDTLRDTIVSAADHSLGHDPAVRAALLKACGLAEHPEG